MLRWRVPFVAMRITFPISVEFLVADKHVFDPLMLPEVEVG